MAKKKVQKPTAQISLLDEIEKVEYPLTGEQDKFIYYKGRDSVLCLASAGSGKTFSCVKRLQVLLERGVDPKKIMFVSFTKAATEELKERVGRDDIRITTIHAYCVHVLSSAKKFKKLTNFFSFIKWYENNHRPTINYNQADLDEFREKVSLMYDDWEVISSKISAYKLQKAEDNVTMLKPDFFNEYLKFQRETRTRDFSDMLIEVHNLFKQNTWLSRFKGQYDYIFIDEFQDTSAIQMRIMLALNAKYYYMIGDLYQSLYGYSGSDCEYNIEMVNQRRKVIEMTLTKNFRSGVEIVNNSNNFSELVASPSKIEAGNIDKSIKTSVDELIDIMDENKECAVLVRTNKIIKTLELILLRKKYPMHYFNYFSNEDIKLIRQGDLDKKDGNRILKRKWNQVKEYYESPMKLLNFIETHKKSKRFITTIHKSKGREYDTVVLVNSVSPELLIENKYDMKALKSMKLLKKISFNYDDDNREAQNIHYVGVTRPKDNLFYMLYGGTT